MTSAASAAEEDELKRVLLVDDEAFVLEALERSMFELDEDVWEVVCERDSRKAAQMLRSERFDIVISDMRMPGIDGASLLTIARDHQPSSLRVVLSGQSDREAALRAVPVAHRFLAKPCQPGALIDLIERSRSLDRLLERPEVQRIARSVKELPSRPRVYNELVSLVEREQTTIADIAAVIESEPALCARVLHLVNSAFFSLPRSVSTIREAVTFLGTQTLQSVVLCSEVFRPSKIKLDLDLDAEQARAFVVGVCARDLAGEAAFTAGILHRVGCLVLALSRSNSEANAAAVVCEHAAVGAFLLGSWGLAHDLVEAVAFQRSNPLELASNPVATAVHMSVGLYDEIWSNEAERAAEAEAVILEPAMLSKFSPERIERCRQRIRASLGVESP